MLKQGLSRAVRSLVNDLPESVATSVVREVSELPAR